MTLTVERGDREARRLFDAGFETMVHALPKYDAKPATAYNLSHLTKQGREVHSADRYHRIHVQLLAVLHALRAIRVAGIDPDEIDLILLGTLTPDYWMPSTAALVKEAIGK